MARLELGAELTITRVLVGLSRDSHRGYIARAVLEGVALQIQDILQAMSADGTGMYYVDNSQPAENVWFFPFGGSRGSFYGDLKAQGRDAIEFYTDRRVVISRW